jgi:DNA mismatch repair protein MutL
VVGILEGGYALLETEDGTVTLDPKAAQERVLFEQLMANHDKDDAFSQRLLLPETVQLPPADAARLTKHLAVLQEMGFAVDLFGDSDHFVIEALPSILGDVSCRELLANIAHDLESAGVRRGTEKWREEIIAKAACRVRVGQTRKPTIPELEKLVAALVKTRMPYTCPRGRPTMIFTSYRELDRKFGK